MRAGSAGWQRLGVEAMGHAPGGELVGDLMAVAFSVRESGCCCNSSPRFHVDPRLDGDVSRLPSRGAKQGINGVN